MIAKKAKASHTDLVVDKFPDDELRVQFKANLKGKNVVLVQSFYSNVSDCIIECILAAETAAELGAKKIILAAPYFPYLRQDKRFRSGEAVSQEIIAELFDLYFDSIYIIDPHLHRKHSLKDIFHSKTVKLTANLLTSEYIKKHIKNPIIMGPDEESFNWAKSVADSIGAESRILKKIRYSSYHVEVKLNKYIELKDRNVVIVDDIISTGHTIVETAKLLRKMGAGKIYCACVHGIFAGGGLKKLKAAKVEVISANTVPNEKAKIDVSGLIAKSLR